LQQTAMMMPTMNTLFALIAFGATVRYVWLGLHASVPYPSPDRFEQAANTRDRGATGLPDYVTGCVFFLIGCALLTHVFSLTVAYGFFCVTAACRSAAGLLAEERERARGRRAALLQRAPRIDAVLFVWIALAALSTFVVIPSTLVPDQRGAAAVVAISVALMVFLAWRIATAPTLLSGDDVEAELVVDRTRRIRRTGSVAMVAIAAASFYAAIGADSKTLFLVGMALYAVIGIWLMIYLRVASRTLVPS
jgi:hypothetical protein